MKPTENLKKSDKEKEAKEGNSVFDFLYSDDIRISTLLSQFNNFGHLTNITHENSAQKGKHDTGAFEGSGSAIFAKAQMRYEGANISSYAESSQRSYNPRWTNTLNFLAEIDSRAMLKHNIMEARIGDLILVNGPIAIKDLSTLEKIWGLPAFKQFAHLGVTEDISANRSERRKSTQKNNIQKEIKKPSELDLFFDLVKILPHTTQITIDGDQKAWGILKPESLISTPSDFVLKYGGRIPGQWAILGILDAEPEELIIGGSAKETTNLQDLSSNFLGILEPIVRQLLGRPADSFGITPLVILREIGETL